MRPQLPSWMTHVDRGILERLQNEGNDELVLGPRAIADNTDFARSTVRNHLIELRKRGLVDYFDEEGGIYQLSDRGRKWLAGDLGPEELEDDEEGDNADGLSLYGEVKAGSPSAEHAVFVALGFALGLIAIWQLLP